MSSGFVLSHIHSGVKALGEVKPANHDLRGFSEVHPMKRLKVGQRQNLTTNKFKDGKFRINVKRARNLGLLDWHFI